MRFARTPIHLPGGNALVQVYEGDALKGGRLVEEHEIRNRVIFAGLDWFADAWGYPLTSPGIVPKYIALGVGYTATTDAMTTLVAEGFRKEITRKIPLTHGVKMMLYVAQSEANGGTLREAGLFTAASGGDLFARFLWDGTVKTSSISLIISWSFIFAAA